MKAPGLSEPVARTREGEVRSCKPGAMISSDKSVRGAAVKTKLKLGQIIVEQPLNGIIFSFPSHCWPMESAHQRMWIDRLTPWWDMELPQWSPTAHRMRESCVKAINKLLTRPASENREPLADGKMSAATQS